MTGPVLIVDDDFEVRDSLGDVLVDSGYEVAFAVDGQQALDLLQAGLRPLAILLDVMMPVVDGLQFRALQRCDPDPAIASIPVVILSADRHVVERAGELEALACLTKPTRIEAILDLLEGLAAPR